MNKAVQLISLVEALKPSQYREYVKGWDKSKYENIFRKYAADKKAYRIYIPLLGKPDKKVVAPEDIEQAVSKAGYEIENYVSGIASKDGGKRKIKIGKLLADKPELAKKFSTDPKRAGSKKTNLLVVISRHPYDIAGMSTDRGWTSCMNLEDGAYRNYVINDVEESSLVAYLIEESDKNINNPIARVLIKPFTNAMNKKSFILVINDKVYGSDKPGFRETVEKWIEEVNQGRDAGIYCVSPKTYQDSGVTSVKIGDISSLSKKELIKYVSLDPSNIQDIENPDKDVQLAAVKQNGYAIRYIKNPDKDVQLAAVKQNGYAIRYIKNPDKDVQLAAVKQDWDAIEYIENPDKDVQLAAVKQNGYAIRYIKNPDKDVQLAAVKQNGYAIRYIENPDPEVVAYVNSKVKK